MNIGAELELLRIEYGAQRREGQRRADLTGIAAGARQVAVKPFKSGAREYSRGDAVELSPAALERLARHGFIVSETAYQAGQKAARLGELLDDVVFPREIVWNEARRAAAEADDRIARAEAELKAARAKRAGTLARLADIEREMESVLADASSLLTA